MKLKIKESWGCRGCYFNVGNCACNEREQCIDQVIHNCAREEIIYLEDTDELKSLEEFHESMKFNDDHEIDINKVEWYTQPLTAYLTYDMVADLVPEFLSEEETIKKLKTKYKCIIKIIKESP